jgi:geranylgeranyl diphosphate synthase type II
MGRVLLVGLMLPAATAPQLQCAGAQCGSSRAATPQLVASLTKFDLAEYMEEKRVYTEAALDGSLASTVPETDLIVESMRYSLMAGGKRVRPMLCFAATEMFGGSLDVAKPTAVALEMIHTMSLIHDDLPAMDNDDLRRGKPTNHVLYGDDVAILAGDAMLSESFAHVARCTKGVPAERVVRVLGILGDCVGPLGLAGGQVLDLKSEGKADVGMDTLTWIHTHKTAALLKASVAAGAVLAGASDDEVAKCEEYALKIGLAFQVADDILDVEASSEDLGKTAGKDEATDKTTYPKLLGLDRSKEVAKELVDEAKAAIAEFGDKAAPLNGLADYIIQRKN